MPPRECISSPVQGLSVCGHAHPAQTLGCETCQQLQVQAQRSTCWILWQALFSPSLLKKTMPVFNKWNWTEASYRQQQLIRARNREPIDPRSTSISRTPYASGVSNLAVTKLRAKLIRRTLSWLAATSRHVWSPIKGA